jgi:hypothetical protein
MTIRRRPHRSNNPAISRAARAAEIVSGIKSIRGKRKSRLNWTDTRLRKLVPTVYARADREGYFRRAVDVLRAWPAMTREQMLSEATRNYYEKDARRWVWRPDVLEMMREYARRAPVVSIDTDKLQSVLDEIGVQEARERFMALLLQDLERRPVTNLKDVRFLRRVKRAHDMFQRACWHPGEQRWDTDTDIALLYSGHKQLSESFEQSEISGQNPL